MSSVTPFDVLQLTAMGHAVPRGLHVVAELGVADVIGDNAETPNAIANAVGANADALARVLRLLSAHGIFEMRDGRFGHSSASRLLRSDHPQSVRAYVRMLGIPVFWACYQDFKSTVCTGRPAAEKVIPEGVFAYLADHPELGQIFDAAMTAKGQVEIPIVLGAYDFSRFGTIADIGGGRGHLLQAILKATPTAKGVLFDLPQVINNVQSAASDRLRLQGGDFFKDALPICDAYVLMEVIHDWSDAESTAILSAVRRAAPAHAMLLLIESLIPDDPGPHFAKMLDILMMTVLTGRQRTRAEYETLLVTSGFRLKREIETAARVSILEAVVA